ncbi:MAG: class I tRNA ligase family protein [Acidobacteria bacterium]|nr:class I tRNA ligase family protein [Acidobacteriota bacterium]
MFFELERFHVAIRQCARAPERDAVEVRARIERTLGENPRVCVTRNTAWGIPAPGAQGKTVYSWMDSLLAKVSMVLKRGADMEEAYWRDPMTRRHFFLGMDGVPFYGALLPGLLLASACNYSIAHWLLVPNEVFIYEGGVCSKSTGTGNWLEEALATLPADFWRKFNHGV